jgi:hypothetical protein
MGREREGDRRVDGLNGDNECLSREFDALCKKRGLGAENARVPEGAKAGDVCLVGCVHCPAVAGKQ